MSSKDISKLELTKLVQKAYDRDPRFSGNALAGKIVSDLGLTVTQNALGKRIRRIASKMVPSQTLEHPDKDGKTLSFSAMDPEDPTQILSIEDFCEIYNQDYDLLHSYKFITHSGNPHYNCSFRLSDEEIEQRNIDFKALIQDVINVEFVQPEAIKQSYGMDRCIFTDIHLGMGFLDNQIYDHKWNFDIAISRARKMVETILAKKKSNTLYIDMLGDLLDGYGGKTSRGGHDLVQNMDSRLQFKNGLLFLRYIMENLVDKYETIEFHLVANDNHSGAFGSNLCHAFKEIAKLQFNIDVECYESFLDVYYWKNKAFVLSHGKDDIHSKWGMPVVPKPDHVAYIDQWLKNNKVYQKADDIFFCSGDSHQTNFDFYSSPDFAYFKYGSFCPQSDWIQHNFGKGKSCFFVEHYSEDQKSPEISPFFFED